MQQSISFAIWQKLILPGQESALLHWHKVIFHFLTMSLGQPSLGREALKTKEEKNSRHLLVPLQVCL